ncbi:MAG: 3-phosphoshikimate 1-carboxyvinyltransferase [Chitinophagales bacterium]
MKLIFKSVPSAIQGAIKLEGSKSISNRLLIMQALCPEGFEIDNLSPSDDTTTLKRLLSSNDTICDVGAAGTTMRFLTAYFAIKNQQHILTGSDRMKQRPIKLLVDALRDLGADIQYKEKDGYPPIEINGKKLSGGKVTIRADVSSQYISALLMIGPVLENGLELYLEGKIGSFPYINMTLRTMAKLGIQYKMDGNTIHVYTGNYVGKPMQAESDWSAASYFYGICALSKGSEIKISGLFKDSLQGDSVLPEIYNQLGVVSYFEDDILVLSQVDSYVDELIYDFSNCPDLAQTVAVTCAALGVPARFTGLESLKIKETDRTAALQTELQKFGVSFLPDGEAWVLNGATVAGNDLTIHTYEDHRMAMCFAPLSLKHKNIIIEEPMVVKKSYPSFWSDLSSLGFESESI